jgi:hypothetical protein
MARSAAEALGHVDAANLYGAGGLVFELSSRASSLAEHDLFRKPVAAYRCDSSGALLALILRK